MTFKLAALREKTQAVPGRTPPYILMLRCAFNVKTFESAADKPTCDVIQNYRCVTFTFVISMLFERHMVLTESFIYY